MTRRLLPYEHQLVETLGISEVDYLEFLALQKAYNDPKAGTALDVRNAETVAIVLTVVGILFQVGAALLAPKPDIPDVARGGRRQREQRFAPTYGFNSAQELARYGDPVNLVYCNTAANERGAVRAATSLVWSAIRSSGNNQFMQLLLVIGASRINELAITRTGFGDVPLSNFDQANTWLYYEKNGAPTFTDQVNGNALDPARTGRDPKASVCLIQGDRTGCSQAFTPSNYNTFGIYDPIPLNVIVYSRGQSGGSEYDLNGIQVVGLDSYTSFQWTANNRFKEGDEIEIVFRDAKPTKRLRNATNSDERSKQDPDVATNFASDIRRQLVDQIQPGSVYELGTARLTLIDQDKANIDKGDVVCRFRVTEGGLAPSAPYNKLVAQPSVSSDKIAYLTDAQRKEAERFINILRSKAEEVKIKRIFDPIDPSNNIEGVDMATRQNLTPALANFTEQDKQDAEIVDTVRTDALNINFFGVRYYFLNAARDVEWIDDTGVARKLSDATSKAQGLELIDARGSIEYTKFQRRKFLANKPKVESKELRDYLQDRLVRNQTFASNLASGKFDDEIRTVTANTLSWIKEGGTTETVTFSLANSGINEANGFLFNGDSGPRSPQDQIKQIRSRYKVAIADLQDRIDAARGPSNQKFRTEARGTIEDLRENRRDAVRNVVDSYRDALILQVREAINSYTDIGGTIRIAGIRELRRRINAINGKNTTDQAGVEAIRAQYDSIIARKQEALQFLRDIVEINNDREGSDVLIKALVKVRTATYQTISPVDFIQFSIRARLFRRISGRQRSYGSNAIELKDYSDSDNGVKQRVAFFKVQFRKETETQYTTVPYMFAVKNAQDREIYLGLNFKAATTSKYSFRFIPVGDFVADMQEEGFSQFAFIELRGDRQEINVDGNVFSFAGAFVNKQADTGEPDIDEGRPAGTQPWDLMSLRADTDTQFSFEQGPELAISAVTEQQTTNTSQYYNDMSTLALSVYSGQGVQDLRSITAYVTKGKDCYVINGPSKSSVTLSTNSSCYAPDIFLDTVWSSDDGILSYSSKDAIDYATLFDAKRFCLANNLFMDGVIADQRPWREFWAEVAGYSLLELVRKNGQEALAPAVPFKNNGVIDREIKPTGLFTSANILEGSFKEEHFDYGSAVQDLIATVVYRDVENEDDVFSPKASVTVKRNDGDDTNAIYQNFDLSQFVSTREQAILYAKYLINQRRFIRRGIEFKTLPTEVPVEPGSYILVDIGLTPWDNLTTGVVLAGGELNSPLLSKIPDSNNYTALVYKDRKVQTITNLTVTNGLAASLAPAYVGYAFVLGAPTDQRRRSFRVTEVALDEEGEITIKAVRIPCDIGPNNELLSRVADFSSSAFVVV
jgi:hypothetical protein